MWNRVLSCGVVPRLPRMATAMTGNIHVMCVSPFIGIRVIKLDFCGNVGTADAASNKKADHHGGRCMSGVCGLQCFEDLETEYRT